MGEINYRPLMEDFVWSYSRIAAFDDCPHKFYLRYIKKKCDEDRFYSSYGLFMHSLLALYYRGLLTKKQALLSFLEDFSTQVTGVRPPEKTVQTYIRDGVSCLKALSPLPCTPLVVEQKFHFKVGAYNFVGYIDYLGEKDGDLYVVDHKSKSLQPTSGRRKQTQNDRALEKTFRQLYLYAAAVEQAYGRLPSYLCLNCFRTGAFIKETFDKIKYEEAKQWAVDKIEQILNAEEFQPKRNFFSCFYICGVSAHCSYDSEAREEAMKR